MVKHNNQIPNQHFKKHWHGGKNGKGSYVRTWFNQPARKHRRATGVFRELGIITLQSILMHMWRGQEQ